MSETDSEPVKEGWDALYAPSGSIDSGGWEALAENEPVESDSSEEITELTPDERELVQAARDKEHAIVVEQSEVDPSLSKDELDEYMVVDQSDIDQLDERVGKVREALEKGLIDHGALCDTTVEQLSIDALWSECEKIADSEPERLTHNQNPETGGIEALDSDTNQSSDDIDEEDIKSKLTRARQLSTAAPERAAELRSEAAALANVDSFEDIDLEVL